MQLVWIVFLCWLTLCLRSESALPPLPSSAAAAHHIQAQAQGRSSITSPSSRSIWQTVFGVGRGGSDHNNGNGNEDNSNSNSNNNYDNINGNGNSNSNGNELEEEQNASSATKRRKLKPVALPQRKAKLGIRSVGHDEGAKSSIEAPNQRASVGGEREALYEAYNQLHTLAQDFQKPFDAPAVIVVGHQTSGKSALIEALMGFQFNQVGGGTKTRRPIALRMQYNANCITPLCFLTLENGKEEQRSLSDIQAYIEAENKRLERDPSRSFDPREINIRMEYRYCPNMIVIDTPGLIHPPKGRQLTVQQRAIAQASREAESLVLSKIRCQDYIILCVEDTTDWKHATTRNIVMQADPQLARTVLVTTKLDTKLPQFSEPDDLEEFLNAALITALFSQMLGGPFFTTVPSGRVGSARDLDSNEAFVDSLRRAERFDRAFINTKMGPTRARSPLMHVGVSRLRAFLEARVEDCYRRNVAKIVPLLQHELQLTEGKLQGTEEELKSLSVDRLKQSANLFRDRFAKELSHVIQGTVRVSPEEFGETLEMEQMKGGNFLTHNKLIPPTGNRGGNGDDKDNNAKSHKGDKGHWNSQGSSSSSAADHDRWQEIIEREVGNNHHKLFGGAQILRAFREFTIAVRHMETACVSEDEIANAAGIGEAHNGVNFMRAACVIAMDKAQQSFEPILGALHHRMSHIMKRTFPILQHLIRTHASPSLYSSSTSASASSFMLDPNNRQFQDAIRKIYDSFIDMKLQEAMRLCRADLYGMTKFVSWDIEDRSGSSTLFRLLPTPKKMVEIYKLALAKRDRDRRRKHSSSSEDEDDEFQQQQQQQDGEDVFISSDDSDGGDSMSNRVLSEWKVANGAKKTAVRAVGKTVSRVKTKLGKASTKVSPKRDKDPQQQLALATLPEDDPEMNDYYKVVQLTEEMVCGSNSSRTSMLITSLVQYIISSWRNYFARSTAMKFNSYFIVPFTEEFPDYLRDELEKHYDSSLSEMFDIAETRRSLLVKREELLTECDANNKLQRQFDRISSQLSSKNSNVEVANDVARAKTEVDMQFEMKSESDDMNPY